jgi:hypothetical protein
MANPDTGDCQDNRRNNILNKYHKNPQAVADWLNSHGWPAKVQGETVKAQNIARGDKNPSITISTDKKQIPWRDWGNTSYQGDFFHLAGLVLRLDPRTQFPDLLDALDGMGTVVRGFRPRVVEPPPPPPPPPEPLKPFPAGMEPPRQPYETGRWAYLDESSLMIMMVIRSEVPGEKKEVKPWIWDGSKPICKGAPKPRPLFGLNELAAKPDAPVLVVEGEKCAVAAQAVLIDWAVVTWPSGADAVPHADWSPLQGRAVWVWPDADESGQRAAQQIAGILSSIRLIDVSDQEKAWDIADAIADGWTPEQIRQRIATATILQGVSENPPFSENTEYQGIYSYPDVVFNKTGEPRILGTSSNLAHLLKTKGMVLRRNLMTREIDLDGTSDGDLLYQRVLDEAMRVGFPEKNVNSAMAALAKANDFHPFRDWVMSKPWDGVDRMGDFLGTMAVENGFERLKQVYLQKFLLSVVTAAFTDEPFLCKAILTLHGEQHLGKSSWFSSFLPNGTFLDGATIDFQNKDDKLKVLSHLVAELGEIEATFRRSDIAVIKAFTGSRWDHIRRPYARSGERMERRTVLVASVNHQRFLTDPTGNVRFWVLPVTGLSLQGTRSIDSQQLFRQVYDESYGKDWWLSKEELEMQAAVEENFRTLDPIEEMISTAFRWDSETRPRQMTATEVLQYLGYRSPTHAEVTRCAVILQKRFECRQKKTKHSNVYLLPPSLFGE